jgi:hypothetical protein
LVWPQRFLLHINCNHPSLIKITRPHDYKV